MREVSFLYLGGATEVQSLFAIIVCVTLGRLVEMTPTVICYHVGVRTESD
jgi:hypothetical protein